MWNHKIERYTLKQINRNKWRFDPLDDVDDVMQEAKILYVKVDRKYSGASNPIHLFALYRTALSRMFTDKGRRLRKSIKYEYVEDVDVLPQPSDYNYGLLSLILKELPSELKTVLQALTTGRVRLKLDGPTGKPRFRENHNMRLKRRLSLSLVNPVGDLRAYFVNT